jgi:superfamily II DNA or RNA helicase
VNRIRQIEAELRELESRREALVAEGERLAAAAREESGFTPSEKIELFLSLFRCREDVYPKLWENAKDGRKGYSPACGNEWFRGVCEKPRVKCAECFHQAFPPLDEAAARDHLTGKHTIGTYAIRQDNSCVFLAADFDGEGWREDILAYRDAALGLGIGVALEKSRSGNGGHAWIFFREPVPALAARRLGTLIVAKASSLHPAMALSSYDRFFPNQDILPPGGFGNLIALPLQAQPRELGNSVFLDENLEPVPDQWSYLVGLDRVGVELLDEILEREIPPTIGEDAPCFEDSVLDLIPSAVTKGCYSGTTTALRRAQLEIPTDGLPSCLVAALKRLATLANPVFFQKQRLRFGTYDTPRFIFCGEIHPGRIVLPRGVVKEAKSLFRKAGGKLRIEDKRPPADSRPFAFDGKLGAAQETAVAAMLEHDEGVLIAPPGAGKTVMGCAIIAERKVATLILVHRKPLMEQWQSRLCEFLGLGKSDIGILGKTTELPGSGVVIGMIQTLVKSLSPAALLAPFTQVIIDECHHVPAASFEAVMKESTAIFFLGLTATPNRKDGLQKILFLQCGAIRHKMEPDRDSSISRKLIVRDIKLGLPPEEARMPIHEVWDMLVDHEGRNQCIVADVITALSEKRHCALLSDRKRHLGMLEEMLKKAEPERAGRIHLLNGTMGKRERAEIFSLIESQTADGGGFILLATSSLIGEGFDLPQLDTLFLTLPISFKGRLIQYAGRLDRSWKGKTEVRIYDYVEPENRLTAHMFRKRASAYRTMGYEA